MSDRRQRRKLRRSAKPAGVTAKPASTAEPKIGWILLAVVGGLLVVCLAFMTLNTTIRTLAFWISRDDYVRTELKIKAIDALSDDPIVFGFVMATGEEVHVSRVPSELYEFASPSAITGTVMTTEKARGRLVPIWFAEDHRSSFMSDRVLYVSEFPTLPSGNFVLGIVGVNLALFAVGVGSTWAGARYASRNSKDDE